MKQSLRAKRSARKLKRKSKESKLNLVSLMDIFTILVFFLLVNSSDVEVLQTDKTIKLPESTAEQKPATTLVVRINNKQLFVGNRELIALNAIKADADTIQALTTELTYQAKKAAPLSPEKQKNGRAITIVADAATSYKLLKRVMATCASTDYRNISLAVSQIPPTDKTAPIKKENKISAGGEYE